MPQKKKHPGGRPPKEYTVYIHEAPNGKLYVGITGTSPKRRWRNGEGYWSNEHFSAAIKKYGWENIKHLIIAEGLTRSEAEEMERDLIKKYNTNNRRYGYNIEQGGMLNKAVSEETRKKLRERSTGVHPSDETRRKMSEAHKGEKCRFYGTHLTEDEKAKLRVIRSKAVEKLDADGNVLAVFSSMNEAAEAHGVKRQAIYSVCAGKRKRIAGYGWRWKNGETNKANQ